MQQVKVRNSLAWCWTRISPGGHTSGGRLGEKDNWPGVVSQLTKRVGLIKKMDKILPLSSLKSLVAGLFSSKLLFGLGLYGAATWTTRVYRDSRVYKTSTMKEDIMALQRLQIRALRVLARDGDFSSSLRSCWR